MEKRYLADFWTRGTYFEKLKTLVLWDLSFEHFVSHFSTLVRNFVQIVLRASKFSTTCVLVVFGFDLEKSFFVRFLNPRYLPCKISNIRNQIKIVSRFRTLVSRTSKLSPTCFLGALGADVEKIDIWPMFGPLQISKIRNSGYWFWV